MIDSRPMATCMHIFIPADFVNVLASITESWKTFINFSWRKFDNGVNVGANATGMKTYGGSVRPIIFARRWNPPGRSSWFSKLSTALIGTLLYDFILPLLRGNFPPDSYFPQFVRYNPFFKFIQLHFLNHNCLVSNPKYVFWFKDIFF